MRKRKYLIGASLGVIGALVVAGTAFASNPTSQTLNTTASPSKNINNTPGTIHNVIITNYTDFTPGNSPSAKETKFTFAKGLSLGNGNAPACPQTTLLAATSTTAVQSQCASSVVGSGTAIVNNSTSPAFPGTNPVLLVKGGPTTLYVWVRIGGLQTLVLTGAINKSAGTLDVTGLPNTNGVDLTNFDTTFLKQGKQSYVKVSCPKGKWVVSETTTYWNNQSITASSPKQKCKAKVKK
jgi:hypothetical protein